MMSRVKVMMACLSAVTVIGVPGASVVRAAAPVQPQFTKAEKVVGTIGTTETIKSYVTIEARSQVSRLWSVEFGTIIRCEKDTTTGTIGPNGIDNGDVAYKECKIFLLEENKVTGQWEEGPEVSGCKIKESEIKIRGLGSRLVWSRTKPHVMLVLYSPEAGETLVTISIEGGGCPLVGTFEIKGSVLARVLRPNEEALMGYFTFDTRNQESKETKKLVRRQLYTEWEVERLGSGVVESGTAELKLNKAPESKILALESAEQVQRETQGTKRGSWGIHE